MRDELLLARELALDAFVGRWQASAASERSNYQLFLIELCELLDVGRPEPATGEPEEDKYVFETCPFPKCGRIDHHRFY